MIRRQPRKPSPSRDWRALTDAHRPHRVLDLSEATDNAHDNDVDLRLRTDSDGCNSVVLVAAVVSRQPDFLRALGERITKAADALEKSKPDFSTPSSCTDNTLGASRRVNEDQENG